MSMIISFLKSIDSTGKEFKFKIEGGNFTTPLGGFLTIFRVIGYLVCAWYFGIDIIERKNPKIIKKETVLPSIPFTTLNSSNFFIAFRVEDKFGQLIDDTQFIKYKFKYETWVKNDTGDSYHQSYFKEIVPHRCTSKDLLDKAVLNKYKVFNYYCVNLDGISVGGSWTENKISYLKYYLNRCKEDDYLNTNCLDNEEILKKYPEQFLNIFSLKNLMNPKDYEQPVVKNYEYSYFQYDFMKRNKQYYYFTNAAVETDSGMLIEDLKTESYIEFDHSDINYSPFINGEFYSLSIFFTHKQVKYNRAYMKIPSLAARVSCFMNLFLLIFNNIWTYYIDNEYMTYLINNLFKIEIYNEEEGMNKEPTNL